MKVTWSLSPCAQLPSASGAHELAWSHVLDTIFSDAYYAGLTRLHVDLPMKQLEEEVRLRASLSHSTSVTRDDREAVALLGDDRSLPEGGRAHRVYLLEYGGLAPASLRRLGAPDLGAWQIEAQLRVYTLSAQLFGVLLRLTSLLQRPDLHDRAAFAMRRAFVNDNKELSYYRLTIWRPRENHGARSTPER